MGRFRLHTTKLRLLAAFAVGLLWAFSIRFILMSPIEPVHYHANFAIYVNGERDMLESFAFYEEVAACGDAYSNVPSSRAHLHDQIPTVIHVHDEAVTWSNFFDNIGYRLSDQVLETDQGLFVESDGGPQVRFILNGQERRDVSTSVINSEDVLLVDYSSDDTTTLQQRYEQIPADAAGYNSQPDPAACAVVAVHREPFAVGREPDAEDLERGVEHV